MSSSASPKLLPLNLICLLAVIELLFPPFFILAAPDSPPEELLL